jgi:hypothetical protein
MAAATFKNRVEGYTNFLTSEVSAYQELLGSSMGEVMKALPDSMTIPLSPTLNMKDTVANEITALANNDIVLAVFTAAGGKKCLFLEEDMYEKAKDSDSIYKATALNPVYTITSDDTDNPQVKIHPTPAGTSIVYTFPIPSSIDDAHTFETTEYLGIPRLAQEAIVISTAIKCLQAKLSDYRADEDSDMVQATRLEMESLQGLYQMELSKLLGQPKEA